MERKPGFSVLQVQVMNGFAYLVVKNVGTGDAHNVRVHCLLELIEGNITGETTFPLATWKSGATQKFAVRFKTDTWYRYFDTSPLKITIRSTEASASIRLD